MDDGYSYREGYWRRMVRLTKEEEMEAWILGEVVVIKLRRKERGEKVDFQYEILKY